MQSATIAGTENVERYVRGLMGMTSPEKYRFVFLTPVWGLEYTSIFIDVCLPMLLTAGNLNRFRGRSDACFVILTTAADFQNLQSSPVFQRLQDVINVRAVLIDGLIDVEVSHAAMTDCYQKGMRIAGVQTGFTNFIYLTPDSFWSDGTFEYLEKAADLGKKAVVTIGLRTKKETITPTLKKAIENHKQNGAILTNRELAEVAIRDLHPMGQAHLWFSDKFLNSWPSNIYWKIDKQMILSHNFHMHPIMVRCPRKLPSIDTTIDGDFLTKLGIRKQDIDVITDSDDVLGIELSPEGRDWGGELNAPSVLKVRQFGLLHANPMHWHFFEHCVQIRGREYAVTDSYFRENAEEVVARVLRLRWIVLIVHRFKLHFYARVIAGNSGSRSWIHRSVRFIGRFAKRVVRAMLRRIGR